MVDGAALAALAQELADGGLDDLDGGAGTRSARNHLTGIVTKVTSDLVMSQVELQCGRYRIVSLISTEAVRELGLEVGSVATAVIKATNVSIEGLSDGSAAPGRGADALPRGGMRGRRRPRRLRRLVAERGRCRASARTPPSASTARRASLTSSPGGAPADVFASADRAVMQRAVDAGLVVDDPVMFATNRLVVIVPADNPAGVTGFDESLESRRSSWCARWRCPCGAAAHWRLADAAGLELRPVSEESRVADVLGKVASGEADAGLVYATDAVPPRPPW